MPCVNLERGIDWSDPHLRRRMQQRSISHAQIMQALRAHTLTYPAGPLRGQPSDSIIYVAGVDGRELKVYVERDSSPPYVRTAVWKDEEE